MNYFKGKLVHEERIDFVVNSYITYPICKHRLAYVDNILNKKELWKEACKN